MDRTLLKVGLSVVTLAMFACSDDAAPTGSGDEISTEDTGDSESTAADTESAGDDVDTSESETTDTAETAETAETSETAETAGTNPSACPEGEVARAYDGEDLTCASLDEGATEVMNDNCQTFFGWRDSCDDCNSPPAKWGYAGGTCTLVAGGNSQCVGQNLGGDMVPMLGINLDGTADGNDKFYTGFDCAPVDPETSTNATCPAGQFVTGIDAEGEVTCSDLASLVTDWGNESCGAYIGWIDFCPNCTDAPSKWAYAGGEDCNPGVGDANTCAVASVDGRTINLAGINSDGNIDDNDTFYLSVDCLEADPSVSQGVSEQCPAGEFVSAIDEDGLLTCTGASALFSNHLRDDCSVYMGWRDGCNNCSETPSRWAGASVTGCSGVSDNAQCNLHSLSGAPQQWMASVGTGGDVGDDDKFYVGFICGE